MIDRRRVSRGRRQQPIKCLIFGAEGVGKTTWAAGAPGALFVDLDRGSFEQNVDRVEVDTFDEVLEWIEDARTTASVQTLVIDSLSRLEALITARVCGPNATGGLAEYGGGYGKGDDAALQVWRQFLGACDRLNATKNVVLIGHAAVKTFNDPLGLTYDRFTLSLRERATGPIKQWVNYTLFARAEISTRPLEKTQKKIATASGARYVYTDANPAYDAKHRGNLPAVLPMAWQAFADAIAADRTSCTDRQRNISAMLAQLADAELTRKVVSAATAAATDSVQLAAIEGRLETIIAEKVANKQQEQAS